MTKIKTHGDIRSLLIRLGENEAFLPLEGANQYLSMNASNCAARLWKDKVGENEDSEMLRKQLTELSKTGCWLFEED